MSSCCYEKMKIEYYFLCEGRATPVIAKVVSGVIMINGSPYCELSYYDESGDRFAIGPIINEEVISYYLQV